jgi:hypothetical protein
MPLRPHTTSDSEKENITHTAAQPTCTIAGSPCVGWEGRGGGQGLVGAVGGGAAVRGAGGRPARV